MERSCAIPATYRYASIRIISTSGLGETTLGTQLNADGTAMAKSQSMYARKDMTTRSETPMSTRLIATASPAKTSAEAELQRRCDEIACHPDAIRALLAERDALAARVAPVQGYSAGIPWSLHLEAYDAYRKRYGAQPALIEGGCRGGFHVTELDEFVPGWREKVSEIGWLRDERDQMRAERDAAVKDAERKRRALHLARAAIVQCCSDMVIARNGPTLLSVVDRAIAKGKNDGS